MKLRAIRVASVGPFADGVAIEDMSGGLDLLVAPNETGKSTIFRALSVLFRFSYTSAGKQTRALQPATGGSPLVEVEFDIEGRRWKLTKRWFSEKFARLTDVSAGRTLRGADAEAEVAALMGGNVDRGRMTALLWVEQNKSVELPVADDETAPVLARLVEGQIAEAVGTGQARSVRALVRSRLDTMLTNTRGKSKANTEYAKAEADVAQLRAKLSAAREQANAATERMQRLAVFRAEEQALADLSAVEARAQDVEKARQALKDAEDASRALETARLERVNAEQAYRAANDAAAAFSERLGIVARTGETLVARRSDHEALAALSAAAEAELAAARQGLSDAAEELRVAREARAAAEARRRRADQQRRRAAVASALAGAREAVRDLATAEAGIVPIDAAAVRELEDVLAARDRLRAELGAAAPRVTFDLDPTAADRVRVEGRAVAADEVMQAEDEIEIAIAGIGRIRVSPGGGASLSALREKLGDLDGRASEILDGLAQPSLDVAKAVMRSTAECEAAAREARARLNAFAPGGLAVLEREASDLDATLGPDAPHDHDEGPDDPAPYVDRMHAAEQRVVDAQQAEREAAARAGELDKQIAVLVAAIARDEQEAEKVAGLLPPAEERAAEGTRLVDLARLAKDRLDEKVLTEGAWKSRAPSPDALSGLDAAYRRAVDEGVRVAKRLEELRREMAALEGALLRDGETGSAALVGEVEAELQAAEARVQRFERECRALLLIDRVLTEVENENRDTLTRPVRTRLEAYAGRLMPGVEVLLGDVFAVSGINRWSRSEAPASLSMGTVEQLGLLSRLAYAKLLADQGVAVPVVFDDPLIHADDGRIEKMFDILAEAATHHQVVVLSCHAAAFGMHGDRAGATRLQLTRWKPDV